MGGRSSSACAWQQGAGGYGAGGAHKRRMRAARVSGASSGRVVQQVSQQAAGCCCQALGARMLKRGQAEMQKTHDARPKSLDVARGPAATPHFASLAPDSRQYRICKCRQ